MKVLVTKHEREDHDKPMSVIASKSVLPRNRDRHYMQQAKTFKTEERAFKNKFALVSTFTKKLNRENALAAKNKTLKKELFKNVLKH